MTALQENTEFAPSFEIRVASERELVRIALAGELDLATAPRLRDAAQELISGGFEQLAIDLRGLTFIDVTGVRLLLDLAAESRHAGWRLSLIQGGDAARRCFALTDTLTRLPFTSSSALVA